MWSDLNVENGGCSISETAVHLLIVSSVVYSSVSQPFWVETPFRAVHNLGAHQEVHSSAHPLLLVPAHYIFQKWNQHNFFNLAVLKCIVLWLADMNTCAFPRWGAIKNYMLSRASAKDSQWSSMWHQWSSVFFFFFYIHTSCHWEHLLK